MYISEQISPKILIRVLKEHIPARRNIYSKKVMAHTRFQRHRYERPDFPYLARHISHIRRAPNSIEPISPLSEGNIHPNGHK